MKNIFKILSVAAGVATMAASCTDYYVSSEPQAVINANICQPASDARSAIDPTNYIGGALGILWTPADTLGVFSDAGRNVPFINQSTANAGRTQFKGDISDTPVYAYYPYSALNAARNPEALVGSLSAEQHWSLVRQEIAGDYKYGAPRAYADNEFDFTHIFSLLKVSVDVSGTSIASEKLVSVEIIADNNAALCGDFEFSAIDGSYAFATQGNSIKLIFDDQPAMADGTAVAGYMSCAPSVKKDDKLTVVVTTDSHKAKFGVTSLVDYAPGNVYNFNIILKNHADGAEITDVVAPVIKSFGFTAKNNPGKILAKRVESRASGASAAEVDVEAENLAIDGLSISGMIPYLYDFNLVADFAVPEGCKVYAGGVEQVSGVSTVDFSSPVDYEVVSPDGSRATYAVALANTGLPVMVISQSAATLAPDQAFVGDLKLRSKSTTWVEDDEIALYDTNGKYTLDKQNCGVRLRGNSTQNFPKKPMAIKLKKKTAIGDMPKHKRWVLLANWLDNSMMRNNVAFAIAHATERGWAQAGLDAGLTWNPHGTNVELVIDGRHVGNYYLCEQIKIDANRLNINDNYADRVEDGLSSAYEDCGYLMECDDNYDEAYKFITSTRKIPVMLKDDANTLPSDYLNKIKAKINGIETNLKNGDYTAAYADIDINSFIDQWIVFELTMNEEYKHPKSVYLYMNGGNGKLCAGPVWDFDWQTFPNTAKIQELNSRYNSTYVPPSMSEWMYSHSELSTKWIGSSVDTSDKPFMWYPCLFKDAAFRKAVQTRWAAMYPQLQAVAAWIYEEGERNAVSWSVNHAMWPTTFSGASYSRCFNGDEQFSTYREVVENLGAMYQQRLDWMNTAITGGKFATDAK